MKKNYAFKLTTHGFLILEHLIAIVISSTLILLILSCIHLIRSYASNVELVSQNQIDALATQLQIESKTASHFKVLTPAELDVYLQNGSLITYRIQNQKLIRQVSGKGGEVALYHCHALNVTLLNDRSVSLTLQTPNKSFQIYLTTLALPLPITSTLGLEEELALAIEDLLEEDLEEDIQIDEEEPTEDEEQTEPNVTDDLEDINESQAPSLPDSSQREDDIDESE